MSRPLSSLCQLTLPFPPHSSSFSFSLPHLSQMFLRPCAKATSSSSSSGGKMMSTCALSHQQDDSHPHSPPQPVSQCGPKASPLLCCDHRDEVCRCRQPSRGCAHPTTLTTIISLIHHSLLVLLTLVVATCCSLCSSRWQQQHQQQQHQQPRQQEEQLWSSKFSELGMAKKNKKRTKIKTIRTTTTAVLTLLLLCGLVLSTQADQSTGELCD